MKTLGKVPTAFAQEPDVTEFKTFIRHEAALGYPSALQQNRTTKRKERRHSRYAEDRTFLESFIQFL
jgi:hypothetical protein